MVVISLTDLVAASVIMTLGGMVQGGVGFGLNLVAAPLLAFVDPNLVPGPAVAVGVVLTGLLAIRERAAIDRRGVGFALVGRVPGSVMAAFFVASVSVHGLAIAVGVGVLLAVLLNVLKVQLRPTPGTLLAAGFVSGFSGTSSSIGGPPMAVVYANEPGPVVRGSLSMIFVVGGTMSLIALASVGKFGVDEMQASLLLMFPALIGTLASRGLTRRLDRTGSRAGVLLLAAGGAVLVLAKELL